MSAAVEAPGKRWRVDKDGIRSNENPLHGRDARASGILEKVAGRARLHEGVYHQTLAVEVGRKAYGGVQDSDASRTKELSVREIALLSLARASSSRRLLHGRECL